MATLVISARDRAWAPIYALSYNFTLPQEKINNCSGCCSLSIYHPHLLSFHLPDTVSSAHFTDATTLETLSDVHMVPQQPGFHPRPG